ncbi:MAG: phosphodiesterase [Clostridia bacterium]|nr:phosphodiesterase [Clostridia bacterium]
MKIGIISDTHGDLATWQKVMAEYFIDVDYIIHAGDVLYHGPRNPLVPGYNPAGLAEAINGSSIPVVIARGNCDANVDQLVLDFPLQAPYALIRENSLTVLVNHGDGLSREAMVKQAHTYRVDIFISGHTHEPLLEIEDGVILLNPGSCALPKGDGTPTVALLENKKISLININTGAELAAVVLS